MEFVSPAVAKFVAWVQFEGMVCGTFGLLLAAVGMYYDRIYTKRARFVIASVVVAWLLCSGVVTSRIYANPVMVDVDVCSTADNVIYLFMGCWLPW